MWSPYRLTDEIVLITSESIALKPHLGGMIKLSDIFDPAEQVKENDEPVADEDIEYLQKILSTYYRTGCNRTRTAQELGISRSTLWRKLKQLQK